MLRIVLIVALVFCFNGCDLTKQTSEPKQVQQKNIEEMSDEELKQLREEVILLADQIDENSDAEPAFKLPDVKNWQRGEIRGLPADDSGFSVAYDSRSGGTVTLYQYTRGETDIPDQLGFSGVKREFNDAKDSISAAAKMGIWDSAKELSSKTIKLGNSSRQALWARFELTKDGSTTKSEVFVWAYNNNYIKLRCSYHGNNENQPRMLVKLLTALGEACE